MKWLSQILQVIFYPYILELKKQFGKVREFGMKNRKPLSEDLKFSESELI